MSDDAQWLRAYAECGDESAFAEIVRRHIDLVWGAGYRVTGDADLARDIAQTAFIELARSARRLPPQVSLAAWLYRVAYYASVKMVRSKARRTKREIELVEMHSHSFSEPGGGAPVESLLPALDEAIAQLNCADRQAIILRFLRRKSLAEVGSAFGISDDAAQKRLSRALDKLRDHFRRRGFVVTSSAVAAALGSAASQACPPGLAATVAASSLAAAGTAGAASGFASFMSTLPSQLALMKSQIAIGAIALATVATPLCLQEQSLAGLRAQNRNLRNQTASLESLRAENARLKLRQIEADELAQLRRDHQELLELRGEADRLRNAGVREKAQLQERLRAAQLLADAARARVAEIEYKTTQLRVVDEMKHLGLVARVFANDYEDGRMPASFQVMSNELSGMEIDTNRFEFMPQARPLTLKDSDMILFREKVPRLSPGGTWSRVYGLVDGSVQQRGFATGNFEEYEHQHTIRAVR